MPEGMLKGIWFKGVAELERPWLVLEDLTDQLTSLLQPLRTAETVARTVSKWRNVLSTRRSFSKILFLERFIVSENPEYQTSFNVMNIKINCIM